MNIFDILGPVMVGPSSSHTAGAVRIGAISRKLLADKPVKAEIYFHGSFALTGVGHGTDKAIVAGLLGMETNDMRIPESMEIAKEEGLEFSISKINLKDAHPNSALIKLKGENGRELEILAASVGGGRISIEQIDGIETHFSGDYPTLIVHNIDQPGHVAEVTSALSHHSINIAALNLYRNKRGGYAVMIAETDQPIPDSVVKWLEHLEGVIKVTYLNM
ncbi:MAG: L-serine ammonia-lyase, iron-sulfur-dependent subunit beta [Clostridia bacterium]|nr:L-serine ammonia-lyase, iron-sulfur-dependent subunit beta [Clostridia bacterium]